ncbi:unnamed protein product [Rhizophagus irregularis]|nr:unnamed protein product [Rhizophagus irregularis]
MNEMMLHHKVDDDFRITKFYGITQDPGTENYEFSESLQINISQLNINENESSQINISQLNVEEDNQNSESESKRKNCFLSQNDESESKRKKIRIE